MALRVQGVPGGHERIVRIDLRGIGRDGDGLLIEEVAACVVIGHGDIGRENLRRGRIVIEGDGGRVAVVIVIQRDGHRVLALRVQRVAIRNEGVVRINLRRIRGNGDGLLIEEAAVCIVIGHGDVGRENLRLGFIIVEGNRSGGAGAVAVHVDRHGVLALRAQGVACGRLAVICPDIHSAGGDGAGFLRQIVVVRIIVINREVYCDRAGTVHERDGCGSAAAVAVHRYIHAAFAHQLVAVGRIAVLGRYIVILTRTHGGEGLVQRIAVHIHIIDRHLRFNRRGRRRGGRIGLGGNIQAELRGKLAGRIIGQHIQIAHVQLRARVHIGQLGQRRAVGNGQGCVLTVYILHMQHGVGLQGGGGHIQPIAALIARGRYLAGQLLLGNVFLRPGNGEQNGWLRVRSQRGKGQLAQDQQDA